MKTYGTLRREKGFWVLNLDAHVRIVAKRVFAQLKKEADRLVIVDNVENCRNIDWFCQRYPMAMTAENAAHLSRRAKEHREQQDLVARLLSGKASPRAFDLAVPARAYQRVAANLILANGFLLLADDVGLGKTCSSICVLTEPRTRPALIVTRSHLCRQWEGEIKKFAPALTTHILKRGTPYDFRYRQKGIPTEQEPMPIGSIPDVLIATYDKIRGWADALAGFVKTVVFDEIQALRHGAGKPNEPIKKAVAAYQIAHAADFRVGLSATPIFNYGIEIWNVFRALAPDALGTKAEFQTQYCIGERLRDPKAFGLFLRDSGMMLRRTRQDVGRELPEIVRVPIDVETDDKPLRDIMSAAQKLAHIILEKQDVRREERFQAAGNLDLMVRKATGVAKCLAPGTRLLRADGTIDVVENIRVGDHLMGPDSKPRRVLRTTRGTDEMFEVSSTARLPLFAPYTVNSEHVLALRHSGAVRHGDRFLFAPYERGDHFEISVREYLTKSKHFRRLLKGYKVAVEYPRRTLPLDPYFLGLWLGDGTSKASAVTTADPEIREYLEGFARGHGLGLRVKAPGRKAPTYCLTPWIRGGNMRAAASRNPVLAALRGLRVLGNKHIPEAYLLSSREQRMSLLAGLLDSDGHLNGPGSYTIATRWCHLAEELCRLATSLGLAARFRAVSVRNQSGKTFSAYNVGIYGNGLESLPMRIASKRTPQRRQRKDPLRSGISVRPVGPGAYYGFELQGDGLFLLHDCTVTHNSPYVAELIRMIVEGGEPVVGFAWHRDVYGILMERLRDFDPALYTGSESEAQKHVQAQRFIKGETPVLLMSLRSGEGLDGLQTRSRTAVFCELDWSPYVMDQNIGRLHRDGARGSVVAYFPLSDEGSDPPMADVLQIKRAQGEGIRNPERDVVENLDTSGKRIKEIARAYLSKSSTRPASKGSVFSLAEQRMRKELRT